jgi:hypothetical protein
MHFIVADDQSIRIIECCEFRDLCMFLREMLTESDIPHRDKMRESIITASLESSEALYLDLAVSFSVFFFCNVLTSQ